MREVTTEVEAAVEAGREAVFDLFLAIDVTSILRGYGPLPAVVSVENPGGRWDAPGQTRVLRLADGSRLEETLTDVDRPGHFAYELRILEGPLRHLVRRFRGAWWFEAAAPDGAAAGTRARWRYAFEPRSRLALPLVAVIVRALWRPYLARALGRARAQAEASRAEDAPAGSGPPGASRTAPPLR